MPVKPENPKISIITPSFNQGQYLEQTILSVLDQQYSNLEFFIIDGGSNDNSIEIIKKYSDKLTYWVSEKDKGQSEALNKGLKLATGDIITWLNSDDWYAANTFETVIQEWNRKQFDVLHGDAFFYYGKNNKRNFIPQYGSNSNLDRLMIYWNNKQHCNPPQPSVFINKKVFDAIGLLDEQYQVAMDYDLWLRIAQKKFTFRYIPQVLSYYRFHETSKSGMSGSFVHFYKEWHSIFLKNLSLLPFIKRQQVYFKYLQFYYKSKYAKAKQKIKQLLPVSSNINYPGE